MVSSVYYNSTLEIAMCKYIPANGYNPILLNPEMISDESDTVTYDEN
jgi:hypothetical protein